jgi:hypothetical protein
MSPKPQEHENQAPKSNSTAYVVEPVRSSSRPSPKAAEPEQDDPKQKDNENEQVLLLALSSSSTRARTRDWNDAARKKG